jgi:hypothetical protein
MLKRLTVRDTEMIARRIAFDKVRKKEYLFAPEILEMERELTEALGTRVAIEPKEHGGKLSIDFMSEEDLRAIFSHLASRIAAQKGEQLPQQNGLARISRRLGRLNRGPFCSGISGAALDDRSKREKEKDENTFDPTQFSI